VEAPCSKHPTATLAPGLWADLAHPYKKRHPHEQCGKRARDRSVNGEIRGDVFPNDDAKAPYSDASLGDYMEALDKVRPFYDLDDEQMEKVYAVFEESLFSQLDAS
jgi:hypothetical protein